MHPVGIFSLDLHVSRECGLLERVTHGILPGSSDSFGDCCDANKWHACVSLYW